MPRTYSFGVASFLFRDVTPGAIGDLPWDREFLREIFIDNEDSIRNYWRRASLGLLDLDIEFINPIAWTFDDFTQADAQGGGGRNRTLDAARRFFAGNDISIQGYDRLVVVVPPMPIDWGAIQGSDIVFEQIDIPPRDMQHEFGHSFDFMHAFGPGPSGDVYGDPYCVMGLHRDQDRAMTPPANLAARPKAGAGFWRSAHRPSACALWRSLAEFKLSPQRVAYVEAPGPVTVRIFGLCPAGDAPMTVLAVIPRRGYPNQFITVEYRPASGDDLGVTPAVVVHTVGVNPVHPGQGEVDPPWYEGKLPVTVGAAITVADYRIRVASVATGPPESVEVDIQYVHFAPPG